MRSAPVTLHDARAQPATEGSSALLLSTSPPGGAAGSSARAGIVFDALRARFSVVDAVSMSASGDQQRAAAGVHLLPWPSSSSRWAYARSLARGGSAFVGVRGRLSTRLREMAADGQLRPTYDLIWSHFLITAPAALSVPARVRVLDADFALGAAARRAVGGPSFIQRTYLRLDAVAITRRERRLCGMFDLVTVASALERERLGDVARPVSVVPNVVPEPPPVSERSEVRDGLLFVGTLDYDANIDAVRYLVADVFPRVQVRVPTAQLTIVGRNPDWMTRRLAEAPGVRLVADAPSVEPFYATARAVVVPLRAGGGTRIKVLEAMARSLAIVATPAGIEGLRLHHGDDALVAADAAGLAAHCVALLQDPTLADRLGRGAHAVWNTDHRPSIAHEAILRALDIDLGVDYRVGASAGQSSRHRAG